MRRDARQPYRDRPLGRPVYAPGVIRSADAGLARLARELRTTPPDPMVLARVHELLCGPASPLYGTDERALHDALGRLLFLLATR